MPNPVYVNILDTYYLAGLWEGLSPVASFFRDRYFPTAPEDIFAANKVLVEYQDGDTGMAPFMVLSADPIGVSRQGYQIHDYEPTCIKQSIPLTADQLKQRGFGEAILSNSTEEERAASLAAKDLAQLERRFSRTEELLCANTMINNGFQVNEMIDANTIGNIAKVQYYDPAVGNDGAFTINNQWTTATPFSEIVKVIRAICRSLARRGLRAADLLLGQDVSDLLLDNVDFRKLVDKNSGIRISEEISIELSPYDGVSYISTINFGGYRLNVITVDEQYAIVTEQNGVKSTTWTNYFPAKSLMVTAPGCGHLMYAHIDHMNEGGDIQTITAKRVPDLFVDRKKKQREIILESRPLAAPKNYAPWVYAANVVA